jgi:hypothetical protein
MNRTRGKLKDTYYKICICEHVRFIYSEHLLQYFSLPGYFTNTFKIFAAHISDQLSLHTRVMKLSTFYW